ncbi:Tsr1131 protein [uncultured Candidatus Thioglobus sp.]|nr:Tsr1131 protein [uncultured Candidatus Thioglobus sp.]
MKGKILSINQETQEGLISAEDNKRYQFNLNDQWQSENKPKNGMKVDFIDKDDRAEQVYYDGFSTGSIPNRIASVVLAFFLGSFGVHKFYLGYKKQGFIMLGVWFFGLLLFGIPSIVIGIIAFIESILYLLKSDEEFERLYVDGNKAWF